MSLVVITMNNNRLRVRLCCYWSWPKFLLGNISTWNCEQLWQV